MGGDHLQEQLLQIRNLVPFNKFPSYLRGESLLYVLLVRRHGLYWERVGSSLMFAVDWRSIREQGKVRAIQERITLV
jgi:hypothetical protein